MLSKYKNTVGSRFDWLNRFLHVVNKVDRSCFDEIGMKTTQSRILFHIALFPNKPIGNVASSLALKPSTTTAALDVLESKGFAQRSHLSSDRRNICVSLTNDGLKVVSQLIPIIKTSLDDFTKDVDEPEFKELLTYVSGNNPKPSEIYLSAFNKLLDQLVELGYESNTDAIEDYFNLRFQAFENVCTFQTKLSILDRKAGITPNEARILRCIAFSTTSKTIKNITDQIGIRPNVATVSIYGLIEKALINREINPKDRRSASISLTKQGIELILENLEIYNQLFDDYFPGLKRVQISDFHK